MSEYLALKAQIADLQKKAKALRSEERHAAILKIRELIQVFDLQSSELGFSGNARGQPARKPHIAAGKKLPAKYKDADGNTWTGRGIKPRWLRTALESGQSLEALKIR